MAREPSFPSEATVGTPPPESKPEGEPKEGDQGRNRKIAAGVAVGIGSAAIVAALLYANRNRRNDKGNS